MQPSNQPENIANAKLIKDPVSAISHLAGVILSIIGTILILNQTDIFIKKLALGIFGLSLILLYLASTIYHALDISEKVNLILRKIDHLMIYILIAGTYTPICVIALNKAWGMSLLIGIWILAIAGVALTLLWFDAPRWLTTVIYILMGWLVVIASVPLIHTVGLAGLIWLVAGGVLYTIGGVIYATKRPNITFKNFGFHEIFHLFVLGGSLCHYIMILLYLPL